MSEIISTTLGLRLHAESSTDRSPAPCSAFNYPSDKRCSGNRGPATWAKGPAAAEAGLWTICLTKAQDGLFHYQIIPTTPPQFIKSETLPTVADIQLCREVALPIKLQNTVNWKVCHNSEILKCVCMYTDLHTHIDLRLTKYSNPIALEQVIPKKVL